MEDYDEWDRLVDTDTLELRDRARALDAECKRLRAALVTLHRYDDGLRASNWAGLANVVKEALDG